MEEHMDDHDKKTGDEPLLPYAPPAIEEEVEFERAALATCLACLDTHTLGKACGADAK
jgi:hypothetical protein